MVLGLDARFYLLCSIFSIPCSGANLLWGKINGDGSISIGCSEYREDAVDLRTQSWIIDKRICVGVFFRFVSVIVFVFFVCLYEHGWPEVHNKPNSVRGADGKS